MTEPKTYYHGTVKAYLPEILKEGLKPNSGNQFKAAMPNPTLAQRIIGLDGPNDPTLNWKSLSEIDSKGFIYVSPSLREAMSFATFRTRYLKAKPLAIVKYEATYVKKEANAPVLTTEPVVLRVSLPPELSPETDPEDREAGLRLKTTIPPQYLTIIPVTPVRRTNVLRTTAR